LLLESQILFFFFMWVDQLWSRLILFLSWSGWCSIYFLLFIFSSIEIYLLLVVEILAIISLLLSLPRIILLMQSSLSQSHSFFLFGGAKIRGDFDEGLRSSTTPWVWVSSPTLSSGQCFREISMTFFVAMLLKGTVFSHIIILMPSYCTNWIEICYSKKMNLGF